MPAYQENGKWYKQCSKTKRIFGPVDTKEELGEWFNKGDNKDGFRSYCKEVSRQQKKIYYQENSEKIKERNRRYYQENPDKRRERDTKYYQENLDKVKERDTKYYQENLDKIKERKKRYRQTSAGLLTSYKGRAKRRGINFTLTLEWFEEQMTKPEFNICAISGIKFVDSSDPNEPFARSLDRISSTKGYTPDNVRWVCYSHNSWKSDIKLEDMARIFKYTAQSHNLDPVEILKNVS